MSKEEIVGFLNDMIDALTLQRVALLSLLGLLMIALLIGFENRTTLFETVVKGKAVDSEIVPWELSNESMLQLTDLVNKQPLIGGVLLSDVNLKKNRKTIKFWYIKDQDINLSAAKVIASLLPQAFFNSEHVNNEQMLSILNNQFSCVETASTANTKYIPGIEKKMPYLCRLAVPPFTGGFAGFISIGIVRKPTLIEIDALKIELTRISIELYLRDIDRKVRAKDTP